MSLSVHVDSRWRDRSNPDNINPAEFTIPVQVVKKWLTRDRTLIAYNCHDKPIDPHIIRDIRLTKLIIPYDIGGSIGTTLQDISPYLYVHFNNTASSTTTDKLLLNTLEAGNVVNQTPNIAGVNQTVNLSDAIFITSFDKNQGATPSWVQYTCDITQCYRIDFTNDLKFRIFTYDGNTIPIVDTAYPLPVDPARQVTAVFESTPYVRDGRYNNQIYDMNNYNR